MVHGGIVGRDVQQAGTEVGAVVVVSHCPNDLCPEGLAGGLNNGPQFGVGRRFAPVGQVAGENHGFRAGSGGLHFVKKLLEQGFAVDHTMEWIRTSQQVGVTQME
ncbi:hypothetical protein BJQ89_02160 [Arthrobacter sp. ES1]|nr:hypothetical protein [Arthrobacter sp. ES1]